MFNDEIKFARKHIVLTSANHFAGGFGIALLLQYYIVGESFLPPFIGWILVSYLVIIHIIELTPKK